jgi:hypothetical protein
MGAEAKTIIYRHSINLDIKEAVNVMTFTASRAANGGSDAD